MPEPALPSPFGPSAYGPPATSPLPTPPSSTTAIPIQCFPSPTSVVDVANPRPNPLGKNTRLHNNIAPPTSTPPLPRPPAMRNQNVKTAPTSDDNNNKRDKPASTTTVTEFPSENTNSPSLANPPSSHQSIFAATTPPTATPTSTAITANPTVGSPAPVSTSSITSSSSSSSSSSSTTTSETNTPSATSSEAVPATSPATRTTTETNGVTNPDSSHNIPFFHPDLANTASDSTLPPVTKPQFLAALSTFTTAHPPSEPISDVRAYVCSLRHLLDHLDVLAENLPLKHSNNLFQVLSTPPALRYLLFLLSDISVKSMHAEKDVRKAYRYPYLVSAIISTGNAVIRDAFIADPALVHQLLSFLDGEVPLHPSASALAATPTSHLTHARDNNIIVVNVVQILVSYLETYPDVLLGVFQSRATFIPAMVNLLHIGAVPKLLFSMIPETSVHQLTAMDHNNVSFQGSLTAALNTLSTARVFHLLADAFTSAAQTIFTESDLETQTQQLTQQANQFAFNVTDVYDSLMTKLIRPIRVNPDFAACQYLNLYSNSETAKTLVQMLSAAIQLFKGTGYEEAGLLNAALSLTLRLLRILQYDREMRVPSVVGPPPELTANGLQNELQPCLGNLMSLLIDLVKSGDNHSTIKLHIVDLFVECARIGSTDMIDFIHSLRFGDVALKLVMLYPHNSLLHHVICRGVEDALVSRLATKETVSHWLVRSNLVKKIISIWRKECGSERWITTREAQEAPFLSAIVHMACCVHHWFAMEAAAGRNESFVQTEVEREFRKFWSEHMSVIVCEESLLGGCKPKRRNGGRAAGSMGRSRGLGGGGSLGGGGTGKMVRWAGAVRNVGSTGYDPLTEFESGTAAHLVRSGSAHRFGFVEPESSLTSRFDDVFVEGQDDFGECGSIASLFDVGDGVG